MAKATVEAGICGLVTTIRVEEKDGMAYSLLVESDCPAYQNLAETLPEVTMMACFDKIGEGAVYDACRKACLHAACPVPSAIIKTIEVAANMALPKDVKMTLEK